MANKKKLRTTNDLITDEFIDRLADKISDKIIEKLAIKNNETVQSSVPKEIKLSDPMKYTGIKPDLPSGIAKDNKFTF